MSETKIRKLTVPQIRKELKNLPKETLAELLTGLYISGTAADYLNIRFQGEAYEAALLSEKRERIHNCFFTRKGKARLDLPTAKEIIAEFERVVPSARSLLDLKLYCIENGMEIIDRYESIPDSLYRALEQIFRSAAKDMNAIEDPGLGKSLAEEFKVRLANAGKAAGWGEAGFHKCMNSIYQEIRWCHAPKEPENINRVSSDEETFPSDESKCAEPAPLTDASDVLSPEDVKLFYRLFFPLLDFVNEKKQINDLHDLAAQKTLDPAAVKDLANAVWQETSLIDSYLAERGDSIPAEHQAILRSWKRCVSGSFTVERYLKKGAILISEDGNSVYQVRGIKSSLEEMFSCRPIPLIIHATLLPFRGVIIIDGLVGLSGNTIYFGSGIKKQLKDLYTVAKRRDQILTAL